MRINASLDELDGFLTAVHESVHIADHMLGNVADDIINEAVKAVQKAHGSKGGEFTRNALLKKTVGSIKAALLKDRPDELLAWRQQDGARRGYT